MIMQLKKIIEVEKKNGFTLRTMYSKEMDKRAELENILKTCIDEVREEIQKKKNETANIYQTTSTRKSHKNLRNIA